MSSSLPKVVKLRVDSILQEIFNVEEVCPRSILMLKFYNSKHGQQVED